MKSNIDNIVHSNEAAWNLPIVHSLKKYNKADWIIFGCFTYAFNGSSKNSPVHFRTLMDTIGGVNHCFGKRLHWFFRIEGDGTKSDQHIHFVLGGHKVTNGYYHQFTVEEACRFLTRNWLYGIADVAPYEAERDGIGYITKIRSNLERDDYYELSDALRKHIMNGQKAT